MNYFPPIEASNVPIIGYILTFVGTLIVGLYMGMWLQRRKEAHEILLKEMDFRQKREEREYGETADLRKSRKEATETAVKKWGASQRFWELTEAFYANISNPYWKETSQLPDVKAQHQHLQTFKERKKEWNVDAPDLSALYLDRPRGEDEAGEEEYRELMNDVNSTHTVLSQRLKTILGEAQKICVLMDAAPNQEEENRLLGERNIVMEGAFDTARKLQEYAQLRLDIIRLHIKSLQREYMGTNQQTPAINPVPAPK